MPSWFPIVKAQHRCEGGGEVIGFKRKKFVVSDGVPPPINRAKPIWLYGQRLLSPARPKGSSRMPLWLEALINVSAYAGFLICASRARPEEPQPR
jgi:hypothetical protein